MSVFRFAIAGAAASVSAFTAAAVLAGDPEPPKEAAGLRWDREGYAAIADAAVEARAANRRLLLGLSGSPS